LSLVLSDTLSGFALGLSLILAIGGQNAFVLRCGLRQSHIFIVCLVCAMSDAILITVGILGFGSILKAMPSLVEAFRYGGAAFLLFYGARSAQSAWRGGGSLLANGQADSLISVVGISLALTWLNPHVYLDTVILLGSIASQSESRIGFGVGATSASFFFFFSLGYGARFLAPYFKRPQAWRVLDILIATVMWAIAFSLLISK
jgi:L-lysine exporter family protein LysE/ArgO